LSAVTVTAVLVNDQFTLYESWSDLFGSGATQAGPVLPDPAEAGTPAVSTGHGGIGPLPGTGRVLHEKVRGPRSGVDAQLWVLLPAGYDEPSNASKQYPVVMFLPGYPGTPTTWLHALDLQHVMDTEVSAGRVQPFIAVLPTMNVAAPRDTECADVAGGPQVATWLGTDVPDIIHAQTRSLPPGKGWGVTGYSTGGFCSAELLLTHPTSFGAGAVLAGYFSPSNDVTTGDLYGGKVQLEQQNDPQWLVVHRPAPASHLLTVWSAQDPETATPTQTFLRAVRPPLQVQEIRLASGGHNTGVWLGVLPQVLRWLSGHLQA
jgi:enterochelin esterase-like enzyme